MKVFGLSEVWPLKGFNVPETNMLGLDMTQVLSETLFWKPQILTSSKLHCSRMVSEPCCVTGEVDVVDTVIKTFASAG